jgi:hypothetical protein
MIFYVTTGIVTITPCSVLVCCCASVLSFQGIVCKDITLLYYIFNTDVASKEVDLEVNVENIRHKLTYRQQNAGEHHNKFFQNVANFKYL